MGAFDPAPRLPTTPGERITLWVLGTAFCALFAAELLDNFTKQRLSMLFVMLAWGPMLVLHELGHALVARWLGWTVSEVVIGFGKEVTRFRIGSTLVRVKTLPIEGYVIPAPTTLTGVRGKSALIFAAGPAFELLFVAFCRVIVGPEYFAPSESLWVIAWQSAGVAAGIGAVFNLIPYRSEEGMSDGLGIVTSLLAEPRDFAARLASPALRHIRSLIHQEKFTAALAAAELAQVRHGDDPRPAAYAAVCTAANGDVDAALDALEALGHPDDCPPLMRNELLLCAAWAVLFGDRNTLLHDAEAACRRVLDVEPKHALAHVLLGRLQLRRGRSREALETLLTGYSIARDHWEEVEAVAYILVAGVGADDGAVVERFVQRWQQVTVGERLRDEVRRVLDKRPTASPPEP